MDPLTHITAGALGGKLAETKFGGKQLFWFCIIAAWLPDIDNLASLFGPEFYLLYHRGVTHSFLGGPLLALLLAGAFKLFSRSFPFGKGALIAYACIALHIFLDLITSYGTLIFAPLTRARFTTNSIFIIDPIFTIAIILFLVSVRVWKRHAKRIAVAGLCWVLMYPMVSFGVNRLVTGYHEDRLAQEEISYKTFEISTEPFSPVLWKLVVEDETTYRLAGVNIFDLDRELEFSVHPKPPAGLVDDLKQKISMLDTYLWFARYPVMELKNSPEKKRLMFTDLRFSSTVGFLRSAMRKRDSPFTLIVELDGDGKPLNWQYKQPRGEAVVQYIE